MYKVLVPSYLKERFPVYIENRKADLEVLTEATKASDFSEIKAVTHKIKGNAAMYGFLGLQDIAINFEKAAKDESLPDCENFLKKMAEALDNFEIVEA